MIEDHAKRICAELGDSDKLLDIGGWYRPFRRADYVVDILPYETRGIGGHQGEGEERFTADTWILHDLCGKKPLPFEDKQFDYVTCSHVLEDIRDPLQLCSELIRVAKRGYIEVPSRLVEQTFGLEGQNYAGYYHHRWLVDIGENSIDFRFKVHLLHKSWMCHFPKSFTDTLKEEQWVSWLFWDDSFEYREVLQVAECEVEDELARFVAKHYRYPSIYYWLDTEWPGPKPRIRPRALLKKLLQKVPGFAKVGEPGDRHSVWRGMDEIELRG